jgi:molybdopterin-containing oxidoreductase family membrane subunit
MYGINVLMTQLMWSKTIRTNIQISWVLSIVVNIGMWFERFVIIVISLHRDYLPSSWAMFYPTWVDVSIFIGSIGLFFTMFLLFIRVLPSIAMAEVKLILKSSSEQAKKKLIVHGDLDKEQVEYYKGTLTSFDSVEMADYEKI